MILKLEKLEKEYVTPIETLKILRGIDLEIQKGEIISIMGPSGSGKSTLLHILGLLELSTAGTYYFGDTNVNALTRKELELIRLKKIGFVFQTFNLIQSLNVSQNIELPMELLKKPQTDQHIRSKELMDEFGIYSKAKSFPFQLSIGEQQRVAIARAIVNNPDIILCDEPTGNLDEENTIIILEYLKKMQENGATLLIVTHNPEIRRICTRNLVISNGLLKEQT